MGTLVFRKRGCLFCFRNGLASVGGFSVRKEIQKQVGLSMQSPNPALNLAPSGRWTALKRRRLALRWA